MKLDLTRHNRKDRHPSRAMLPSDGIARRCPWIEESVTILSDGTVTCGLDDSDGLRNFGNIHDQTLAEIFANPEYQRLRQGLREGKRCTDCALYQPAEGHFPPRREMPVTLVVEPTVRCNLRCPQIACHANNSRAHQTRDAADLPRDILDRALAELGDGLEQVYFFNYGDPFMHRDAPGMVADIRRRSAHARIITSTNGIPLASARKAEALVAARLDHIVFTISGMTQESYERYHINGRLETALLGMRRIVEARRAAGASWPRITWRYLVFRWTDSFEEIDAALSLARELGIDDFSLYLTHIPEDSWSYRLAEGTPGHARYRRWIAPAYGYVIPASPVQDGLYPPEDLALFGRARWTNWRARIRARIVAGAIRLTLSTNSPDAAPGAHNPAGGTWVLVRTQWGRGYRLHVPYCRWGVARIPVPASRRGEDRAEIEVICPEAWFPKDRLGVEDYRCLGVLTAPRPGGTIGSREMTVHPASAREMADMVRCQPGGALVPVASALFKGFRAT